MKSTQENPYPVLGVIGAGLVLCAVELTETTHPVVQIIYFLSVVFLLCITILGIYKLLRKAFRVIADDVSTKQADTVNTEQADTQKNKPVAPIVGILLLLFIFCPPLFFVLLILYIRKNYYQNKSK